MKMSKIKNYYLLFFTSLILSSCTSVEKYNQQRVALIPVDELQKDINYVQKKLYKLHPSLDLYISKQQLDFKFDSIRKTIDKPLTSKEFYFVISPVIASVHQGHMSMSPNYKRYTKNQQKNFKNKGDGPLSQFSYYWENEKLFLIKNKSIFKNIKIGTEIVSIQNVLPQDIYHQYSKSITADGYNKTYIRKAFPKRFQNYLVDQIGVNDSLKFVFKHIDSVFSKTIHRLKPVKKTNSKQTDSIVRKPLKDLKSNKFKSIFGFDKTTNEYSKSLIFKGKDSLVAYLKIKDFSKGLFRKAYSKLFDSIKNQNCTNLIIDLRNNPGGRINEIVNLYSYLTDNEYVMSQPAKVVSKTSLWKSGIYNNIPKISYPIASVFYPFYMGFTYLKTYRGKDGNYYYNLKGSKPSKNNPNYFSGKIYVLINGSSFSASCLLSSNLKTNPNVTFVGEETGGEFNGTVAGIMPVLQLPNSKLSWRLGLMDIRPINQTTIKGHGVFPDVELVPTMQDVISNKDLELDWILEDIKSKK